MFCLKALLFFELKWDIMISTIVGEVYFFALLITNPLSVCYVRSFKTAENLKKGWKIYAFYKQKQGHPLQQRSKGIFGGVVDYNRLLYDFCWQYCQH